MIQPVNLGKTLKRPRAVSIRLFRDAHALQHRDVEVAERRFLWGPEAPPRTQRALAAAGKKQREIFDRVLISIFDGGAEHDHGIIQKGSSALIQPLDPVEKIGKLLHVPIDDLAVLFFPLGILGVVRD